MFFDFSRFEHFFARFFSTREFHCDGQVGGVGRGYHLCFLSPLHLRLTRERSLESGGFLTLTAQEKESVTQGRLETINKSMMRKTQTRASLDSDFSHFFPSSRVSHRKTRVYVSLILCNVNENFGSQNAFFSSLFDRAKRVEIVIRRYCPIAAQFFFDTARLGVALIVEANYRFDKMCQLMSHPPRYT
jgi:hypothetical protein